MESSPATTSAITRIHLIFKTHLDVGFTDFAQNVVQNYFTNYIPKAVQLARQLREAGSPTRFLWTTGSWLIYEYLEQASPAARQEMEQAILAGDIKWHALPFTLHSENMDASLFRFGLSLSQELDQRFGVRTIAAKMTDVPGHTRGIVALLAEAGVRFLHIGVNPASTPPDVPPVFRWRDLTGAEVAVMYHKGSYGDTMTVPGLADGIAFAHTGDNRGPQNEDQLRQSYQEVQEHFPGAQVVASTLDHFAARLETVWESLPVVTQELGDTWIHGAGTDPTKIARYRALLRLRRSWLEHGTPPEKLAGFSRKLLLVPEHTWGLDVKTHLEDWDNYSAADFQSMRGDYFFRKMEGSWEEQRNYLEAAMEVLDDNRLCAQLGAHLSELIPERPTQAGYQPISDFAAGFETQHFTFRLDPARGDLIALTEKANGRAWAGPENPLGRFSYETFSAADYQRYYRQYIQNKRQTRGWALPDFTKPGLEKANPQHKRFLPQLIWAGQRQDEQAETFLLQYTMPEESWQAYGAPRALWLALTFPTAEPTLQFDLQWFDKPATRLPEAAWFSFVPLVAEPHAWRMDKLGQWVSPYDVIRKGNRHLHAVGRGVRYQHHDVHLFIETRDAPLVAPGSPSLLNFTNQQPNLRQGIHFNLLNNIWGTNFPMWYEDDARFRFTLKT